MYLQVYLPHPGLGGPPRPRRGRGHRRLRPHAPAGGLLVVPRLAETQDPREDDITNQNFTRCLQLYLSFQKYNDLLIKLTIG